MKILLIVIKKTYKMKMLSMSMAGEAINKKLCDKVLSPPLTCDPRVLHRTAWFIFFCFGKRVGETQHSFTEVNASSQ